MPRPPSAAIIPVPHRRSPHLVLSETEHRFLVGVLMNFHGTEVEDFLADAPVVTGGRGLALNDPRIELLLNAIGVEVHGFLKLEDEESSEPRRSPKRGGTADKLMKLYRKIETQLS